jgi:hypothetical protein
LIQEYAAVYGQVMMSPTRLNGRSTAQISMSAICGYCSESERGWDLKPSSPLAAWSMHIRSCRTPPKGVLPPESGFECAKFETVPQPAAGRQEINRAITVVRTDISPPPWRGRENIMGMGLSKEKMPGFLLNAESSGLE